MSKNFVIEDFNSLNWLQWCTTPHSKDAPGFIQEHLFETLFYLFMNYLMIFSTSHIKNILTIIWKDT